MKPDEFLKTIYFGDSGCSTFIFDTTTCEAKILLHDIARRKDNLCEWGFTEGSGINKSYLVITDVKKIMLDESGLLPNDEVTYVVANYISEDLYEFIIDAAYLNENVEYQTVITKIIGKDVYLIDHSNPDVKITD